MNILRMLQLTGNIYVPSFYEFVGEEKNKVTEEEAVDMSLNEWAEIPMEWKGSLNGQNHFLSFKKGSIVLIPANLEQSPTVTEEAEGGEPTSTELKDVVDAPVQNSEDAHVKAAQAILDKVTAGSRFTDTSQTGTDSNTAAPEPTTELGSEKVKESIEERAKKIIAAVNASVAEKKIVEELDETDPDDQDSEDVKKVKKIPVANIPAVIEVRDGGSDEYRKHPAKKLHKESVDLTEGADAFDVYLNGKHIDTVWFTGYTAEEAYRSLVNHDGYDPGITVRRERKKKTSNEGFDPSKNHADVTKVATKDLQSQFGIHRNMWEKRGDVKSKATANKIAAELTNRGINVPTIEESTQVAGKVIKSVSSHNHPHAADGGTNPTTEKTTSTDYNKDIDPQDMVDAARDNVDNEKDYKFRTGIEYAESEKVEVPAKVLSQIDQRVKELESSISLYDNKGYNDQSLKQNAIDVLKQIKTHLEMKNIEGLQQAIVLYGTLMSPITGLMPAFLPNYLATATDTEQTVGHKQET